jgi:DNA-binding CsgD family transcriptional regulator
VTSLPTTWAPDATSTEARRETRDLVARLVATVASLPDDDRLLRSVVLDLPARHRASSALLARTRADGALVVVSRFGRIAVADDAAVITPSDDSPAIRALGQPEPFVLPSVRAVAAVFPGLADTSPLGAVRIEQQGVPAAVLVVAFDDDLDVDAVSDHLAVVRDLLSLHAVRAWSAPLGVPLPRHLHGLPAPEVELTPRQITVLRLMSAGLPNRVIADRIGFSESTVRHETMAIYKVFGVGDRRTAALIARTRGLID